MGKQKRTVPLPFSALLLLDVNNDGGVFVVYRLSGNGGSECLGRVGRKWIVCVFQWCGKEVEDYVLGEGLEGDG